VDPQSASYAYVNYLASVLILREAGAVVEDLRGRDLVVLDQSARRTPVAAATQGLLAALTTARRGAPR
jgi:fructose-1,6-bisphosphatase/inositol monophosphatase family enzyme